MESDQLRVHINSESQSQFKLSLETNLELLSTPLKSTPFFIRKKDFSQLIRKSEETLNSHVVLWTLLTFQNSTNPIEFFMTSKEDSNLSLLKDKKKTSNFAESKRNSLDQTRSVISLPMMEEPLNSYLLKLRSKTPLNSTLRLEPSMPSTR